MNKRIARMTLAFLLALGLTLVFTLSIALAQGPDGPDGPLAERPLLRITRQNVADFTVEELKAPAIWERLSPRERWIVHEAIEAGVVEQAQPQEAAVLAPGVNLQLYIFETGTGGYDPSYEPGSYALHGVYLYNSGDDDASGVHLTYTPPASVTVSASFNNRGIPYAQNGSLAWNVGDVESGGYRYFYVETQVYPTATVGTNLLSTASVTCTQVMTPVQETETDQVSSLNLYVDKEIIQTSPGLLTWWGEVKTDDEITYRIQVENESVITDALDVVVTDTLDANLTFVSASSGGVYSPTAHTVVWDAGALGKGQTRSFLVTVRTPVTLALSLNNTAQASTSTPETYLSDNSSSYMANTAPLLPNVGVLQYPNRSSAPPGGEVAFDIYVYNGTSLYGSVQQVPVEDVVVTGTLEGGLEYVSSRVRSGNDRDRPALPTVTTAGDITTVTWDLGTLPNDPNWNLNLVSIDLLTRVPAGASGGDAFTATTAVTSTTQPESNALDNVGQDTITVETPYPDLGVGKYGCDSPRPGGWCVYDLQVRNNGNVPITDAVLIDYLPVGLSVLGGGAGDDYDPAVGDAAWGPGTLSFGAQVVTWTLKPIPPDGYVGVELFVRVSDALTVGHVLTNTAVVTRTTIISDENPGDNRVAHPARVVADAALDVDKWTWWDWGAGWPQPGDIVQYAVNLENESSVIAENTVLTDSILVHASLITATADEGIAPVVAGNAATWDAGDYGGYPEPDFYVTAQVDPSLEAGQTFANLAWASTTTPDSYADDNYDLEYDTVPIPSQRPDVDVYKSIAGCRAPGGVVEISISIDNMRDITATNVVVTDTLPDGLIYGGISSGGTPTVTGQNLVWNLGDMRPYGYTSIYMTATISATLDHGTVLTNTVRATADNEDVGDQHDNVDHHRFQLLDFVYADVAVGKGQDDEIIRAGSLSDWYIPLARRGQPFDYEIWVSNNHPNGVAYGCPAGNVVLRDVLPDGMSFVSASPTPTVRSGQVITWTLGTLAHDGIRSIRVTVRPDSDVAAGEFLRNQVYASSSTYDPDPSNNTFVFVTGINEGAFVYLPIVLRNN
jgi:uncharacterized repeat protein (TIGR01451 family)